MMMDSMNVINMRGICANYFENHVSPVLKYIQQSQERLDKRMDDVAQKLQVTSDALASKASREDVPSFSDIEAIKNGSARGDGMSVPVLTRLQELSTMVQKKADASEISRLAGIVEQKAIASPTKRRDTDAFANTNNEHVLKTLEKLELFREEAQTKIEEIDAKSGELVAMLASKVEAKSVPTLEQWYRLEKDVQISSSSTYQKINEVSEKVETLVVALESKVEAKSVPTLEQWKQLEIDVRSSSNVAKECCELSAQMNTLVASLESKAESKDVPTLEQWKQLETDVQSSSSIAKRKICEVSAQVETLVASLESKAESKNVPTLEQWQRLEKDVQTTSNGAAHANGEKSELKKVQMLVAAAGARFDRQLKELRQQIRDVSGQFHISPKAPEQRNASDIEDPRWPGRVLRQNTDDDVESELGRTPASHCGSISESLAGSVTGLGPEERAELQKIQAVVGAAGTAFSKEIRDLKKQLNTINNELTGLREHVNKSRPRVAGA